MSFPPYGHFLLISPVNGLQVLTSFQVSFLFVCLLKAGQFEYYNSRNQIISSPHGFASVACMNYCSWLVSDFCYFLKDAFGQV